VQEILNFTLGCAFVLSGMNSLDAAHHLYKLNSQVVNRADSRLFQKIQQFAIASELYQPNSPVIDRADNRLFQEIQKFAIANKLHQRSMSEIVQAISEQLLGSSYKAGLLDESNREKLVVSLKEFDCVLFVETVLALSRGVAIQDYSFQSFRDRVRELRYRNGNMDGYCSRLHYFAEWIQDNERRSHVQTVAQHMGGIPLNKSVDFMSSHWQSYPRITSSEVNYQCIAAMERNIGKIEIEYIPIDRIGNAYINLQPGDIIAIATAVPGLDATHTGLVYRMPDGNIGLIHASPSGSVRISSDLQNFVANVEDAIGIMVARPIDPRK
jgi:cell wall-associated NlpC family hydrolase